MIDDAFAPMVLALMIPVAILAWLAGVWWQRAKAAAIESEKKLLEQEKAHSESRSAELERGLNDSRAEQERWREDCRQAENRIAALNSELEAMQKRRQELDEALKEAQEQQAALRTDLDGARRETHRVETQLRELQAIREEEKRAHKEKLEALEKNREALREEFENLANKIFEQKSERFTEQNRTNLNNLLDPFRDQLKEFRKRVDDVYSNDTRDREALRSQIHELQKRNIEITEEASNLTRALKGDKKKQGNWGELILERVLEQSGLRKGIEYETQTTYRNEGGQQLRPDVVVHLPDQRNVIIDSKVSMAAYQASVVADSDEERERALREHVDAVRQHIRDLSEKDYSHLHGIHSPDFVLLFMPIEPAFIAAFEHDEGLFAEAFEKKVVVVTPTTLLATLRTIENIWRYERQSQNARAIADRASAVHDKLRVFVEHMEAMGRQLDTVHKSYDSAMTSLTRGKGNLISQARRFVELGVRVKKELPRGVVEQAEHDSGDEGIEIPSEESVDAPKEGD